MTTQSIQADAAPMASGFPAEAYIRDFRAAGGRIGIRGGQVIEVYVNADDSARTGPVTESYLDAMCADPDNRAKVRAALQAEANALSPVELARLHS